MSQQRPQKLIRISDRLNRVLRARLDLAIDALLVKPPTKTNRRGKKVEVEIVSACIAKMVLVALCDHHGADGHIYPGIARLARYCGLVPKTVQRAINTLEALGVISVTRRNALKGQSLLERTNWYVFEWERIIALGDVDEDDEPTEASRDSESVDEETQSLQIKGRTVAGSGDAESLDQETQSRINRTETTGQVNRTGQLNAAAGDQPAQDNARACARGAMLKALDQAGVREPTRKRLADDLQHVTPADVRSVAAKLADKPAAKRPGAIVRELEGVERVRADAASAPQRPARPAIAQDEPLQPATPEQARDIIHSSQLWRGVHDHRAAKRAREFGADDPPPKVRIRRGGTDEDWTPPAAHGEDEREQAA